jgi:hypothetical protein
MFLHLTPRSTAVRNDYYSFVDALGNKDTTIENPVLSGIEGATIPVIRKLEERQEISLDDRMVLSLFVTLMLVRTTTFERTHNEMGEQLHKFRNRHLFSSPGAVAEMMKTLPEAMNTPDAPTAQEIYEFVKDDEYTVKFHRNASLEMMLGLAIELTPVIAGLGWIIGHAASDAAFVTSDAPFVISPPPDWPFPDISGRGILVRGSTKAIALSQRLCLSMGDPGGFFGHLDLQSDGVRKNNLAFASRAERFVISPNEASLRDIVSFLGWETQK